MTWIKFDDSFADGLPAMRAGHQALGLHLLASCWTGSHLTDGWVPDEAVVRFGARLDGPEVERLIGAGLWKRDDDDRGFILVDYLALNRTRAQAEAALKQHRDAGRRGGQAKAARDRQARRKAHDDGPGF